MNDIEQQDEVLNDLDFKRIHIILKSEHLDFLKKIDEHNISNAIRVLIDKYMKMTKRQVLEKYLLYTVFILCIFTASTLLLNML